MSIKVLDTKAGHCSWCKRPQTQALLALRWANVAIWFAHCIWCDELHG